jgi:hypothetical protein
MSNVEIVVPTVFFIFVFAVIFVPLYFTYKKNNSIQDNVRLCLEKGVAIPPELFQEKKENLYRKFLHRGIILMFTGISLIPILYKLVTDEPVWTVGLIPAIIGIGYFLSAFVFKGDNENSSHS